MEYLKAFVSMLYHFISMTPSFYFYGYINLNIFVRLTLYFNISPRFPLLLCGHHFFFFFLNLKPPNVYRTIRLLTNLVIYLSLSFSFYLFIFLSFFHFHTHLLLIFFPHSYYDHHSLVLYFDITCII